MEIKLADQPQSATNLNNTVTVAEMVMASKEAKQAPAPRATKRSPLSSREEKERLSAQLKQFQQIASDARLGLAAEGPLQDRAERVLEVAQAIFAAAPTWSSFYRELLSLTGVARELFPSVNEFRWFERSEQFQQIQRMLIVLRSGDLPENDPTESLRMVTVRMPTSLHLALCREAEERGISINQLCISRLMQNISDEMIPQQTKGRRGRRPGPQGPKNKGVQTTSSVEGEVTIVEATISQPAKYDNSYGQ